MADVFVSYARANEPQAQQLADALRATGYSVWRDDELPAHRAYAEVIQERLRSAKAVVVLWSAQSARSQWVRSEAEAARQLGTLVQATIDGLVPPMPFDQIQCADLRDLSGKDESGGWRKLMSSIAALAGSKHINLAKEAHKQNLSICVLPFANMSGDVEQDYFSDGITEDITTDLSKVSALAVTARNTAFQFKGQPIDVCEVATKLGVSHVLEGSVRKAGNRVRITAQLIDGATGDHVWAERFDRDLTDIFAIQDELSSAIVEALKINLLPEEKKAIRKRETSSAEAYKLYLMAHNYWVSGNWGDIRQAELVERICKRATEIDPGYASAWGLLAIAQWVLHFLHAVPGVDCLGTAERALALDPDIAEAHIVKARSLDEQGRLTEANGELERAIALGPDSWEVNHEAAIMVFFQKRFEEAGRYFEKAASLDDMDFHSWGMLTSVYEALGDEDGVARAARMSVSRAQRVVALNPTNGAALVTGATGLALLGEIDRFREWKDRALLIDPDNMIMLYNFACVMARLGDIDGALDLLERRMKTITPTFLRGIFTDPDLDNLREQPRFNAMVEEAKRRLGLGSSVDPLTVSHDPAPSGAW